MTFRLNYERNKQLTIALTQELQQIKKLYMIYNYYPSIRNSLTEVMNIHKQYE